MIFKKRNAHFAKIWTSKKIVIFWRKLPLRVASVPKKNGAHAQSSFEFSIPLPIPLEFSEKRMSHSPIPIPSGFKGMTIAADSDFPRPVRSVRRQRLAATVFVRSKPTNWMRFFQKKFMFLTEKTKTDVLHILVRTHILVFTCQQSCMLLVIIDQLCRKCSRSIWMKV